MTLFFSVLQNRLLLIMWLALSAIELQGQTLIDLRTQSKSIDFSGAGSTKPFKLGALLPSGCGVGELFFLTGAPAGTNMYGCTAPDTWTQQGGTGSGLPSTVNQGNAVLSTDGITAQWQLMGGDVTGAPQSMQVGALQGHPVVGTQPSDGQVLRWNNPLNHWEPGLVLPSTNYSKSFTNSVSLTIAGTEHNLGTANLIVSCYDSATPASLLQTSAVTVDPVTFAVNVSFASPKTGRCVVNGLGGSGPVSTAGGDLSGVVSAATVQKLQNRQLSAATPSNGQVITWNQAGGQWQPQTPTGGGGGGAQFSTLNVAFVDSATLSLGAGCTSVSPCNVRFGSTVYGVQSGATATWLSGLGTAYIYMTSAGVLTVGGSLSIACSGCATASNISNFPANSLPLYTWNAVASGWNPTGGADARAYLSTKVLAPGLGLTLTESGTQTTIAVDASTVPSYLLGIATLSFGTVSPNSCSSELAVVVSGATPGDSVAPGWPSSLPANVMGMMRVGSGDTVRVKLCNPTGTSVIVPSDIFHATVVRGS